MITRLRNIFSTIFLGIVLMSGSATAEVVEIPNPLKSNNFAELLANILQFLFILSLPVGSLMIIFAAFTFLTSAGDPEKLTTARKTIIYAFVGIIILFLSQAIVNLLISVFEVA